MSHSGQFFGGHGGGVFSPFYSDQCPPRLFHPSQNGDGCRTPTSSWVTSFGSEAPGNGRLSNAESGDYYDKAGFSRMEVDGSENIDAGLDSLSTSPNSVRTPNEDMKLDQEWIDIPGFTPVLSTPPHSLNMDQVQHESFSQPDQDHGIFQYEHDLHQGSQLPMIHEENQYAWSIDVAHTLDPSFQAAPFSPGANTFLSQPPGQEPWTLVQPRGNNVPTSDVVIWDPESDAASSAYCSPGPSFGEESAPLSPACRMRNAQLGYGTPLSELSMRVGLSISPIERPSYLEPGGYGLKDHRQTDHSQKMFRSESIYSPDSPPSNASPPPAVPFTSHTPCNPVKSEYPYTYTPSRTSTSPSAPNAISAPSRRPIEGSLAGTRPSRRDPRMSRGAGNRPGGRPLGSHLQPEVAADANMMRKVVACWHCVLQRDKCGPGDTCDRCRKRSLRPNSEYGLGCSRTLLKELVDFFLPRDLTSIHEQDTLRNFCIQHINSWENVEMTINLACGRDLPTLKCRVYEFVPKDKELLRSFQYRTDKKTGQYIREEKWSPPLGIQQHSMKQEQDYDRFVNGIVQNSLPALARMLYAGERNDFAPRLFQLMIKLRMREPEEGKLLKEVFRLIVVTYIMAHSFVIVDQDKEEMFSRLKSYCSGLYPNYCVPRMTNRQVKFLFCHLHRKIMSDLLNRLQQIFRSSGKGSPRWTEAFFAVLGLAIANEEIQKSIHILMDAKSAAGELGEGRAIMIAEEGCRAIDQRFQFVMNIFRWKYSRAENPLRDSDQDWSTKLKDPGVVDFIRNTVALIKDKLEYLQERQYIDISHENQSKYTSRLVSRFLLAFWTPT